MPRIRMVVPSEETSASRLSIWNRLTEATATRYSMNMARLRSSSRRPERMSSSSANSTYTSAMTKQVVADTPSE